MIKLFWTYNFGIVKLTLGPIPTGLLSGHKNPLRVIWYIYNT